MSIDQRAPLLDLTWTVNEIVQRFPVTLAVFNSLGVDSCCGGALPLTTVAERHDIGLDVLRTAVERAIRAGGAAA